MLVFLQITLPVFSHHLCSLDSNDLFWTLNLLFVSFWCNDIVFSWKMSHCTIYYWWRNVCVHCKTPEAVLTHPSIHMKTTFADVEPNPAIVCVVGPAAVVTFPFNSRQAAVGGAVLAPGGGFLARAPCPSYNPNPNTSIVFLLGVGLAWYVVQWRPQEPTAARKHFIPYENNIL